jgi:hypothetical protein
MGSRFLSSGVEWPGREAERLPPSSTEDNTLDVAIQFKNSHPGAVCNGISHLIQVYSMAINGNPVCVIYLNWFLVCVSPIGHSARMLCCVTRQPT